MKGIEPSSETITYSPRAGSSKRMKQARGAHRELSKCGGVRIGSGVDILGVHMVREDRQENRPTSPPHWRMDGRHDRSPSSTPRHQLDPSPRPALHTTLTLALEKARSAASRSASCFVRSLCFCARVWVRWGG